MRHRKEEDPVPNHIPLVGFDENDEPFIVKTQLVRPSPIPRSISILVIVMMAIGLTNIVYFSLKRSSDLRCEVRRDRALGAAVTRRVDVAEQDRTALKNLVTAVAKAKSDRAVSRAFDEFLAAERVVEQSQEEERINTQRLLEARCD